VRVKALQAAGARRPGDPARELWPQLALLLVRAFKALAKLRVLLDGARPALDAAVRLEPRDRRDELRAGRVVRGREGRAVGRP